ncbi:MAG: hypothetical protein KDK38_02280 [Leptospiraceae bacterium]|nr:hypothetical protein [Leptospiraceae bacterium]
MANDPFQSIKELLESGKTFIEEKKGQWDHIQWDSLLSDLQTKGANLTDEAKHRFGEALEGLKGIYGEVNKTEEVAKVLGSVKDQTLKFVQAHKDGWDHVAWEQFLAEIQQSGVNLTESTKAYLGNLVEAVRRLYAAKNDQP